VRPWFDGGSVHRLELQADVSALLQYAMNMVSRQDINDDIGLVCRIYPRTDISP